VTSRRLDEELVARGLFPSRSRARDAVLRGTVSVNGRAAHKPAQPVSARDSMAVSDAAQGYVSRAALKLIHGLVHFQIAAEGRHCLDIGASTGGFTQVLLERGASHVTAIDVGHGQMAPAVAADPRVKLLEGLNARDLAAEHLPSGLSLIVCDVSFIALKLALAPALRLAPVGCTLLALVKPQFEVGPEHVGKGGIVSDPAPQQQACNAVADVLRASGWFPAGVTPSPLVGGDGNLEFLICAQKG
jgi:23S rRNA (cytidine1920-2'-O)/16S rRNA (cytidine1409-2'-O)-methyltransferase